MDSYITLLLILIMEANENPTPPLLKLLLSNQLEQMATSISPRLSRLLSTLSTLTTTNEQYSKEELQAVSQAFNSISYKKQVISGPICRAFDNKLKYYKCFTCVINKYACICEICFTANHQNHQFKIIEGGSAFCDCGNDQLLGGQYYCKEHTGKHKQIKSQLSQKDVEGFNREVQFLLYFCLKSKQVSNSSNQSQQFFLKIFEILNQTCLNSYTYQQLLSEIFLRPFSKEYLIGQEGQIIFRMFLWSNWKLQSPIQQNYLKKLAELLCNLYSYEKMRKKILIEYFKLHCSTSKFVIWINPITAIDQQYFLQGRLILRYLKSGKIPPLTLNYKFSSINSTAGCFMQIYRAYNIMSYTAQFVQILGESLARVNFSSFFSFGIIDRESRAAVTIVTRNFLVFLQTVMATVQKMKANRQVFLKIIRESYDYIKTKQQIYNFCPERTLLCSMFSLYQYNLSRIASLSISDIFALFEQNNLQILKETLQKMIQSYLNLFRIENFNDYRELTTDKKYQLNTRNFIVAALDFTCIRILITLNQIVTKQYNIFQFTLLKHSIIGKHCMLQKWVHLHRLENMKKEAIVDPQAKTQIVTLMETGLFVKIDDQIASTTIEFVGIINNLLFACQSSLCETVLSNYLGTPNRQNILMIYRQSAWISSNKPRLAFKAVIQSLIDNKELIKTFITEQYDAYFKGEKQEGQKYESNLSYCSRFFNDEITDDTTKRFIKKLEFNQRGKQSLTKIIFTQDIINQIMKYARYFIKFLTNNQKQLGQGNSISITMNLLVQCMVVIYTETKSQKLKKFIYQINSIELLANNYTDYSKIIIGVLFEHFKKPQSIEEQSPNKNKKEAAKLKRDLKMKQMKQKQDKFLEQHSMPQQKIQQNQDLCIICKTPSSSQHNLNYLCRIRFNNTFNINILNNKKVTDDNMMVITTCRHKIHQKCLAQSIDEKDQYGLNYSCFLCKELSNLRLPLNLNTDSSIETYLQYFLTIISLELSSNQSLRHLQKEYTTPHRLCKLLYDNIVLSIYIYYFTLGKFYLSYIIPIVSIEFAILRWLTKQFSAPQAVYLNHTDNFLKNIEEKVNQTIAQRKSEENIKKEGKQLEQRHELDQLFQRIFQNQKISLTEIKQIQRFNFFKLPKDLRVLTKQIGKCRFCNKFTNKTLICFLCGFKICSSCNQVMNFHIDLHLGTSVLIDVQNGKYCYRYRNMQVSYISLYLNYIGEEFQEQSQPPAEGEYELSQDRLEKLIDQILKDCIQNTVEGFFRQAQAVPACNIQ